MEQRQIRLYRMFQVISHLERFALYMLDNVPFQNAETRISNLRQTHAGLSILRNVIRNLDDNNVAHRVTILIYLLQLYVILVDRPSLRYRNHS